MGRHHDKKYGQGRVHSRMAQRRMRKGTQSAIGGLGMGMGGLTAPLGLIGLLGAGFLGYSLLKKRSLGGVSTFGKTSSFGFGRMSALRSWLPFKNRGFITSTGVTPGVATISPIAAPIAPIGTGIATTGLSTGIAKAPLVHNRKVPLKERALSKITRRPVITNYH